MGFIRFKPDLITSIVNHCFKQFMHPTWRWDWYALLQFHDIEVDM